MGQVAVTLRVMPASAEEDMDRIKEAIENLRLGDIRLKEIKTENMAFGLKAFKVLYLMPDHGGTDRIENAIREIPGVSEVETGEITLI
jgi:translation elongation factor aEF-1 beta